MKRLFFALVLHVFFTPADAIADKTIAVIDTTEREAWFYKPVFDIIEHLGYTVTYHSLDKFLDTSLDDLFLLRNQAVFFIFGVEFLEALTKSHVCVKVLQALYHVAQKPGMLMGLIFPPLRATQGMNVMQACAPVFAPLGLKVPEGILAYPFDTSSALVTNEEQRLIDLKSFFYVTNIFLTTPLESRPREFDTTLNGPRGGIELDVDQMQSVLTSKRTNVLLLPRMTQCTPIVKKTLPYGLYWYNQLHKNHIFITTSSILSFAGITENYHVTPIDIGLRLEMLQQVHRMMWEVLSLAQKQDLEAVKTTSASLSTLVAPSPPRAATEIAFANPEESQAGKRKIAWMDLDVFAPLEQKDLLSGSEQARRREQERYDLVQNMIAAGLDSLWITANPHEYFSPIGRYADRKERYLATLQTFTKCLREGYSAAQVPLPHLYIGFEITNNVRAPQLSRYAMDLYENAYEDIPVPIDKHFWEQEITKPFRVLVKLWQDPQFSHNVPISGVVLDLEMYLRKKSPSFTSMMTFDALSFQRFVRQLRLPWGTVALRDRPLLLMKHSKAASYYRFLEQEAEKIGTFLKKSFEHVVPQCNVMCYKPSIKTSWFYNGLIKGLTGCLSNPHHRLAGAIKPVQLLTFNSEYMAHKPWFDQQDLPVTHSCVLMLSKIRDVSSFDWVSQLLMRHGSVWLNKFSRTIGPLPVNPNDRWTDIERLSASPDVCRGFFDCLRAH